MSEAPLAKRIRDKALELGFDECGIVPLSDLDAYKARLDERIEKYPQSAMVYAFKDAFTNLTALYPWAKSAIVLAFWYGRYRFPKSLQGKFAKSFALSPDTVPQCEERKNKIAFEKWLTEQGLKVVGGEMNLPVKVFPLRQAAVAAGLGVVRKNNFFYGKKGSYYALEGWLCDREMEARSENNLKACPEKCGLCQKACKTKALDAPYSMNPLSCVSFWTTFGGGVVPPHLREEDFGEWVCGCDACQDACPHNRRVDWDEGEEFCGLNEVAELLEPNNIIEASDQTLVEKVIPKTEFHVPPEKVQTLRNAAERALRFQKTRKS
ncbi:MAG: epoxyqueuosine reductase [Thermoguttaceae bacterium]|nr:epoxyqueuosine reductase [Thermoguttaceae bacterium]